MAFEQFDRHAYLNLETFRKNGEGVRTPVWFLQDGEVLYIRTEDGSGKVKRIRRNGQVKVVPSDGRGTPLGEWEGGRASLVEETDAARINGLMAKKYRSKWMFDILGKIRRARYVVIAVRPAVGYGVSHE